MKSKIFVYVVVGILVANYMPLLWNEKTLIQQTHAGLNPSSGWQWVRQLNISNSVADYQIKLRLYENDNTKDDPANGTLDLAGKCEDFPNDIRFGITNDPSAAEQLPQWIEQKVSGETTDYFAYNGRGKRPILDINRPVAIYNASTNKTYMVWQGGDETCDPYICYYDHSTGRYSDIYKIAENPLTKDLHGAPTMVIDDNGYIHVWFGSHSSQMKHIKTQYPITSNEFSLDAWGNPEGFGVSDATYPVAVKTDDAIYLFFRRDLEFNNRPWYFTYSTDNGESWSSVQKIIDTTDGDWGEEYVMGYKYQNNKIHLTWCEAKHYDITDKRRNVYYAYLNLSNHHLYSINDDDLGTCINLSESNDYCMVFDTSSSSVDKSSNHMHIDLDDDGNPYIIFQHDDGTNRYWKFARWTGDSWNISTICPSADLRFYDGRIKVYSSNDIDVYITNGSIYKYHYDGSSWTSSLIYSDTKINNVALVESARDELKIIFTQGQDTSTYDEDLKLWAWGNDGIVEKTWSAYVDIWIKLPNSAQNYIYLFVGNQNAGEYSDGDATFLFFDDFEESLDSNKWNIIEGSVSTGDGKLRLEGTSGTRGLIESKTSFSVGVAVEVYAKANNEGQESQHICSMRKAGDSNYRAGDTFATIYDGDIKFETWNEGNKLQTNSIPATLSDTYHHYKVTWISGNSKFYIDDVEKASHTTNIPTVDQVVFFQEGKTDGDVFEIDWVFVRKYADPEPSWSSFGVWESLTENVLTPPTDFTAEAVSSSQINLTWTKGNNADTTYIERNTVVSWNRGEGTLIYNGTGTSYSDTGLDANTAYYYQAWSYNATDNTYSSIDWTGLDFDGANDNVRIPDDNSLNLTLSFTIDMALYVEDTPADDKFDAIISKMTDANTGWGVALYSEDGTTWELHICVDGHNQSVGTASIPTDTWVYPTVVFNASTHTMHVYINGNEIYSYNELNTPSANTADVVIGECSYVGNDKTFDGKIDYIRVYNKALTEQQVRYNFYWKDSDCVKDGLVSWWKFDENTGTTTYDSWGSNDGILEDGVTWITGTKEVFSSAVADLSSIVVCNITLVSPSNGSIAPIDPVLSVQINSTDGDTITVTFYNAVDDSVIGTDTVAGNGTANVTWSGLTRGSTYSWYVVADDGTDTVTSPTWNFTVNVLPTVEYTSPADGETNVTLYSDIVVNVSDTDDGVHFLTIARYYKTGDWVSINENSSAWTLFGEMLDNADTDLYINATYTSPNWLNSYNTTYRVCLVIFDYDSYPDIEVSYYYWNFTTVAISNTPPYINSAYPAGLTNVRTNPQLMINVSDVDGDLMNITWYWNDSGVWKQFAQNLSVGNGTYYAYNANFSEFNTTYEWKVSIFDGYAYTNATYSFTTEVDDPPYVESVSPANGSTGIEYNPTLMGVIQNPEEYQTFNVTLYWNDSGVWKQFAYFEKNYTNSTLFTFAIENDDNFSALNTTYYWKIVIQDDNNVVSYVYHFTTAAVPFQITDEVPADGATDVALNPTLQVKISRNTGTLTAYFVNVTWKWNDSGIWKQFDFTLVNLTGVTSQTISTQNANFSAYNTTYEWGVFCYDGTYWYNKTYSFITTLNNPPVITAVTPENNSIDVPLQPQLGIRVYDTEGENVTVIFEWNNSGVWQLIGIHSDISVASSSPGTWIYDDAISFSDYNTTYEWRVNVSDEYGNTVYAYYYLTTVPNQPPDITLVSPANDSVLTDVNVTLSIYVSDNEGDTMDVRLYLDGANVATFISRSDGYVNFTTNVSYGNHTWYVTVDDSYGNSVTSPVWTFEINVTVPTVELVHPADGVTGLSAPVTLIVKVTDADNDNATVKFYVYEPTLGDYKLINTVTVSDTQDGENAQTAFYPYDGTNYTWYVVVNDTHGNSVTSPAWSFTTGGISPFVETFDDDAVGIVDATNPSAIWYTPHTYGIFNNTAWSIVNDTAYSNNQSLRGTNYDNGWGSTEKFIMAFNESVDLSSLSFYIYMKLIAGEDNGFTIAVCDSSLPVSAPTDLDVFNSAIIIFAQYNDTLYYMNGTDTTAIYTPALYSFVQWKLIFLDNTVRLIYNGTTVGEYEKIQDTYPKYIVFMAGIIDSEDYYANIYIDDVAVSYTTAPGMNITDNGTAEMMVFPTVTVLADNYTILNASSNFLILYNDYGTIDGTTGYVKVVVPLMQNITNDEMIAFNDGDMHVYAKIAEDDNSTWHDCGGIQDRYVIISDSDWDYSWNRGEHMYIMLSITEPAGFPTGTQDAPGVYDSKQGTSGTWYVYYDSDVIAYDEFNATITIEAPANTPPAIVGVYPENNSTDIHLDSWMTVTIDDPDFWQRHTVWFYWANGTLIDVVRNVTNAAYIYPTLQPATTYEWYVVVNDTVVNVTSDTYTFTTTSTFRISSAPLLFDPYPSADETNVSIPTILSIKVYDKDSDFVVVTFYDGTGDILGICNVTFTDVREPKTASIMIDTYPNTEYSWYVVANDTTNETRYPSSGVLRYTTANIVSPAIVFYLRNASNPTDKIDGVTIECVEKNLTVISDVLGTAVMTFTFDDIGKTYHFIFTHDDYRRMEKTYEIEIGTKTYYIKLTPKTVMPTQLQDTQDIFSYWNANLSAGTKFVVAFIVIAVFALIATFFGGIALGLTFTIFGAGAFTYIGWLPWWIFLMMAVAVAFMAMKILGVTLPIGGDKE